MEEKLIFLDPLEDHCRPFILILSSEKLPVQLGAVRIAYPLHQLVGGMHAIC